MPRQTSKFPVLMDANPSSAHAESYRTLRTNIEFSSVGKETKVLLVTSSNRGEGKSTTAVNLAISFAKAGKRVVLLDADLRVPSLHRIFGKSNFSGLANYLSSSVPLNEIVRETHIPELFLITAGAIPSNPSELLALNRVDALLQELKSSYDIVVIDTTPLMTVADAQILAAKSDGVVLVVEYGKVKKNTAKKLKAQLHKVNANLLGVVLNKADKAEWESYSSLYAVEG